MLEVLFCFVVGITDGDTLKARCGEPGAYEEIEVRLIAISAPKRDQDFAQESKESLSNLCYQRKAFITVYDTDRDGYQNADVVCDDMLNANSYQVEMGYAWVYPQDAENHGFLYLYQDSAQRKKLNIWSQPNPIPPWEWRRK